MMTLDAVTSWAIVLMCVFIAGLAISLLFPTGWLDEEDR